MITVFYLGKEHGTLKWGQQQRHMDEKTLEQYVKQYIDAHPGNEVEFTWQGGEPTLAGLAFYQRALELQQKHSSGKTIRNSVQTNGVLIDTTWATFLTQNNFLVGLSIDGPAFLHDRYRKTRSQHSV